jgi:hypothetical protein
MVLLLTLAGVSGVLLNAQENPGVLLSAQQHNESKPASEHETTQGAAQPKSKLPEAPQPQKPTDRESKISASGKLPAILAPQMTQAPP